MKLASLKDGGRDGTLVVVDRTLGLAKPVPGIAPTLQAALEDWASVEPELRSVARLLDQGEGGAGTFDFAEALAAGRVHSPLPRAYQWLDGSAYVTHVELVRKARGADLPESFWTDPLMYQGASDSFIGPRDAIVAVDESHGIDFESEVAVITDDVPMGIDAETARRHIKLVMLVDDVSARGLIPAELAKGFGFVHGKPASAFSPVAVTPDALGEAWDGAKLHRPLVTTLNGREFGHPNAGVDMTFDFGQLIAHAAKTRHLAAGTIIGSGTVANNAAQQPGSDIGSSCLAERRMLETLHAGEAKTPFLRFGDTVRIEMRDGDGRSIFGAIEQTVERYEGP
ncbi:MAG: 2-keto-4-pentenoate hydratase [Alphaproteobacteria bacterium]|jgi:fumarylacetoacetate (FAA) hydrolase|nr:2-keto-4-pentenoate hydratase [Alphaproteobacteria bacterium]